ncbi:nicotinate phosphoribosyltransferase [Klebsiella phage phiKp_21]|nr:nicotinate phosphoribosyltransferase [Klebsiella phage phiKp_21]
MLNNLKVNLILNTDTYKNSHFYMWRNGVDGVFDVICARKSSEFSNHVVQMGIQYTIDNFINLEITMDDIEEAQQEITEQGGIFYSRPAWEKIVKEHNGKLPIVIRALPEGTVVPVNSIMTSVEATEEFKFLAGYIETCLLRGNWYMSTVATESYSLKKLLAETMMRHAGNKNVNYHLHWFGDRSSHSYESTILGAISHAVYFNGSDCLSANRYIKKIYNTTKPYLSSVDASEHSVSCSNSDAEKKDDFNMAVKMVRHWEAQCDHYNSTGEGTNITSVVIDTYNDKRFVREYIGTRLKDTIIEIGQKGGRLVMRPDSGDSTQICIDIIEILMEKFGYTVNEFGYKVLPSFIGVLQGDGVSSASIRTIIDKLDAKKISLENLVFGMGKELSTPEKGRDRYSWSMKAVSQHVEGEPVWQDLFKCPISDLGKKSHKGKVTTYRCKVSGNIFVERLELQNVNHNIEDMLVTMYDHGKTMNYSNFDEVRERGNKNI